MIATLDHLTEEELDLAITLQMSLKGDELKENFYEFFKEFWPVIVPDNYVDNWHIKYLCDVLQKESMRVVRREPKKHDIIINIPPGTSKSTIVSKMLPAWLWAVDPSIRIISGSYESRLANEMAVGSRDILKSDKFRSYFPGLVEFKADMDMKTGYQNTKNGLRKTCSVGGNITGSHAHVLIIDDPINPKAANSEVEIKTASDWMDNTLSTRKVDKQISLTILIMQRLNESDPSGHWLSKNNKPIYHVCLPSEITQLNNVKPSHLAENYKNGLLDPNRMGKAVLSDIKIDLGSRGYAGQFLQNPAAIEGNYFKRDYWKFYKELPQTRKVVYQSWDTAFKTGEDNDFSCCTTWFVYDNGYYLVDFWKEKVESPVLKKMVVLKNSGFSAHKVLIEDKASGITTIQELRKETQINIVPIKVMTDKISRALDALPTIEAGNVYLPEDKPWVASYIDNLAAFPDAKHDDDVDSTTQFLNYIRLNNQSGKFRSAKRQPKLQGF